MTREIKGILGEKLGMTQIWDDANRLVPVTAVKAGPCVVTQIRTPDRDGYDAAIAFNWAQLSMVVAAGTALPGE